jgi:hypothetical protein
MKSNSLGDAEKSDNAEVGKAVSALQELNTAWMAVAKQALETNSVIIQSRTKIYGILKKAEGAKEFDRKGDTA